jgi:intracellular sulfur oxidation DsrE/DsrF family protein
MNRKDGTTRVFKMFLGDVIFKGDRDEKFDVVVKAIEYYVDDDDFNHVITDFRGNVSYSSMISKLCEYNRRSEFIIKVLVNLLNDNPKQQVLILAHNRNLIKYLHDAIQHRNIATVGYYVGGMKESALKESENKQVIIGSYALAEEGLDIKKLTTLIMSTPKTNIQQSVGRILREKHGQPIVVDIIDSHEPFKNQWKKRRSFYMKEKYKIMYTTSDKFHSFGESEWTTVFDSNNPCSKTKSKPKTVGKKKTNKSDSSTDKSITNDSSDSENESPEDEPVDVKSKNDFAVGKCLISIKK